MVLFCGLTEALQQRYENSVGQLERLEKKLSRYAKLYGDLAEEDVEKEEDTSAKVRPNQKRDLGEPQICNVRGILGHEHFLWRKK